MTREVVHSGCNAMITQHVDEAVEFDMYVTDRVLEIESVEGYVPGTTHIILKKIGTGT